MFVIGSIFSVVENVVEEGFVKEEEEEEEEEEDEESA
jgi:hypothetical protein